MSPACPRALRVIATLIAAGGPLGLAPLVVVGGPLGLAGPAHAVETWVTANGEVRVVPGTEDPPPRVSLGPPPAAMPERAPAPVHKPKPTAVAKPAKPLRKPEAPAKPHHPVAAPPAAAERHPPSPDVKPQAVDPLKTGAIRRRPNDGQTGQQQMPDQPPQAQPRPAYPLPDLNQRPTSAQAPVVDPGNARILVDPSRDTIERTNDPDADGLYPSADTTLTPDQAAASLYPTTPTPSVPRQIPGVRPVAPLRGSLQTMGAQPPITGTVAPSISEQTMRTTPDGAVVAVPAVVPPARTPASPQPMQPTGPLATGSIPAGVATSPRPATAPNPRIMVDDPLADREANAYDQIGIQRGPFIWKPAVEFSAGGTTNIQSSANGQSSSALRIAPELIGTSDWSRHQMGFELRGSFTDYPQNASLYRPTINTNVNGRIDFTDDSKLALKAGYGLDKLPASSALNAAGTTAPGYQSSYTASAAFTRDMGLMALTLRGDATRTAYSLNQQQAAQTNASGLDNTVFTGALRGTYNMSQAVKPFVEVQADARRYDSAALDATTIVPISHDTTGAAFKTGVALDTGPFLTGESSVGAGYENPTASRLKRVSAFTFDENLIWSPTRLTKVTFSTVSAIEPSLIAGASGAVSRTLGVKVSTDLRRNLTVDLGGSYLFRNYTGIYRTENLAELTTGLTWKLSPTLQTFVRGTFDAFKSSAHTDDYTAATVFAGVRLQR
jgi:hypothetical protein